MSELPTLDAWLGVLDGYAESLTKGAVLERRIVTLEQLLLRSRAESEDLRNRLVAVRQWARLPKRPKQRKVA